MDDVRVIPITGSYRDNWERIFGKKVMPQFEDATTIERPCAGANYVERINIVISGGSHGVVAGRTITDQA
ncbi:MAG: hypothetical protein WC332_00960 [Clostridia bacterium]|jgi:hypothetical protein